MFFQGKDTDQTAGSSSLEVESTEPVATTSTEPDIPAVVPTPSECDKEEASASTFMMGNIQCGNLYKVSFMEKYFVT